MAARLLLLRVALGLLRPVPQQLQQQLAQQPQLIFQRFLQQQAHTQRHRRLCLPPLHVPRHETTTTAMERRRRLLALPLRLLQQAPALPRHLQPQSGSGRCRLPAQSLQAAAVLPQWTHSRGQPPAPRVQGGESARRRQEPRAGRGRAHRLPLRPRRLHPRALLLARVLQLLPFHRDCQSTPARMPSPGEALQWAVQWAVQALQWAVRAQLRPLLRLQLLRLAHRAVAAAAATSQRPSTAGLTSTSQARWATALPILGRLVRLVLGLTAWAATSVLRIFSPGQGLPVREVLLRWAALVQAQALDSEGGQHSILSRSIHLAAWTALQALLQVQQLEASAACQLCSEMASF